MARIQVFVILAVLFAGRLSGQNYPFYHKSVSEGKRFAAAGNFARAVNEYERARDNSGDYLPPNLRNEITDLIDATVEEERIYKARKKDELVQIYEELQVRIRAEQTAEYAAEMAYRLVAEVGEQGEQNTARATAEATAKSREATSLRLAAQVSAKLRSGITKDVLPLAHLAVLLSNNENRPLALNALSDAIREVGTREIVSELVPEAMYVADGLLFILISRGVEVVDLATYETLASKTGDYKVLTPKAELPFFYEANSNDLLVFDRINNAFVDLSGHTAPPSTALAADVGGWISAGRDGTIRTWSPEGKQTGRYGGGSNYLYQLTEWKEGFVFRSSSGRVGYFDPRRGNIAFVSDATQGYIYDLAVREQTAYFVDGREKLYTVTVNGDEISATETPGTGRFTVDQQRYVREGNETENTLWVRSVDTDSGSDVMVNTDHSVDIIPSNKDGKPLHLVGHQEEVIEVISVNDTVTLTQEVGGKISLWHGEVEVGNFSAFTENFISFRYDRPTGQLVFIAPAGDRVIAMPMPHTEAKKYENPTQARELLEKLREEYSIPKWK